MRARWLAPLVAAVLAQAAVAQDAAPLTAEQDHQRLLSLLGIESLRPGADGRNPDAPNAANYDEARANPLPRLPDPLRLRNGTAVTSERMWWKQRRAEIVEDFDREVYGRVPAKVPGVKWEVVGTKRETIAGVPVLTKQVVGHVDNSAYPSVDVDIQLTLTTPTNTTAPVPVILQLVFTNPAPAVPEHALAQGWGFAQLVPTSIQPDDGAGLTRGIIGLANQGKPRDLDDWGALRAWAWGASRALDYLETDSAVDAKHVGIEGLSRYGKAALVAMAYDARFAVGLIASSGAGGAKLHRRDFGERVENLASPAQYHWMAGNYLKYAGPLQADDLPVDAHELIALVAPRPLFISVGSQAVEGGWVDARGMFMAAAAAGPVYRLLGARDLGTHEFPPQETALTDGELAFRQHAGGHTAVPNWPSFAAFARRYLPSPSPLLSPLFRDHAVVQRDEPIKVWGWARPGARVIVTLGNATARANADESSRWNAELPAMPAGGPYQLVARTEGEVSQSARDVMVGDVWLCSGQSNMVLQVHRALDSRAQIAASANDSIRMLTVPLVSSDVTKDTFGPAPWQVSSPATVPEFSAACYYFARELQETVNVPMGLINASWGGSNIKAWMSERALRDAGFGSQLDILRLHATDEAAAIQRWGQMWQDWWKKSSRLEPWSTDASRTGSWRVAPLGLGHWEGWNVPELASFNGMVWYRTMVWVNAAQAKQSATLSLGTIDEIDMTWINGRPLGSTSGAGTERRYEIPAGTLRAGDNIIVINALDTYMSGGIYGPADRRTLRLADGTTLTLGAPWRYQIGPTSDIPLPRAPWDPTGGLGVIHNAMIEPLVPFSLRGVLWYQGESNTEDFANYERLLRQFMADWRAKFGSDLPFLVVQLAGYGPPATEPYESNWAALREAQRRAVASDSNAALAVAIDLGERTDVHPANKQEVGRRLARAARHLIYAEAIPPSGPVARSAWLENSNIVVEFEDVTGQLIVYGGARPVGFELCNAQPGSCRFVDASVTGNRVLLEVPPDLHAARVRYCWADSPVCTLYDGSGLPAGPFEIDLTSPTSSHLPGARSEAASAHTDISRRASHRE